MLAENKINILIVDDLTENLRALEAIIRGEDRMIYQARSGEEALDLLLKHDFALVILDVQMPQMNGFELAELMRGTNKTRDIPLIFVTAAAVMDTDFSFKGYEQGAVDFLYKPLDIQAMKSKVNVFVTLRAHQNQTQSQLLALEKSQAELKVAQEELQKMVQMRDQFMSMVAHELRTPLNTLLLDSQVRQLKVQRNPSSVMTNDEIKVMLSRNLRQYQNMVRLIDDMLDVTRIRNGKLSIKTSNTSLTNLVEKIAQDFTTIAESSGATIKLNNQPSVNGVWDELRIEQIIVNLVTNALRYGNGKPVDITMYADAKNAYVQVKDQGVGISVDDQKRIFEPFERASNHSMAAGLGLGLYIAKQLALAHSGDLTVDSVPGEYTQFTLSMPLES